MNDLRKDDRFDSGSVRPRFHGEAHKQQLAFLVIIEGEDLKDLPELIAYPVKVQLKKAAADLEEDNAPAFVENFRKEDAYLEVIRDLLKIVGKEKRMRP